jgi:hypothetical protein
MKTSLLSLNSIATLAVLLVLPLAAAAQHYTMTDLGALGSGDNAASFDMNQAGWIGGSSNLTPGGPQHAFLWYGGGPLRDLGVLQGSACPGCNSGADGPNLAGDAQSALRSPTSIPTGKIFALMARIVSVWPPSGTTISWPGSTISQADTTPTHSASITLGKSSGLRKRGFGTPLAPRRRRSRSSVFRQ